MRERNVVVASFDKFAETAGFAKRARSWYLWNPETIVLFKLQKSQYGVQYYINVALWLRALGNEDTPKENRCQIRTRLSLLVPSVLEKRLSELLDLDSDVEEIERGDELRDVLRAHLLPLVEAGDSLESLRNGAGRALIEKSLITGPAQQLLSGMRVIDGNF